MSVLYMDELSRGQRAITAFPFIAVVKHLYLLSLIKLIITKPLYSPSGFTQLYTCILYLIIQYSTFKNSYYLLRLKVSLFLLALSLTKIELFHCRFKVTKHNMFIWRHPTQVLIFAFLVRRKIPIHKKRFM